MIVPQKHMHTCTPNFGQKLTGKLVFLKNLMHLTAQRFSEKSAKECAFIMGLLYIKVPKPSINSLLYYVTSHLEVLTVHILDGFEGIMGEYRRLLVA